MTLAGVLLAKPLESAYGKNYARDRGYFAARAARQIMKTEVSMRSHRFLIAGTVIISGAVILCAGKKHENWMDEPFTKWDQKQAAELFNKSAWAVTKSFRGQVNGAHGTAHNAGSTNSTGAVGTAGAGVSSGQASQDVAPPGTAANQNNSGGMAAGGVTAGVDVPEYSFTAKFFSAQPIREAYVRLLQITNHYDTLPPDKQKAFDQQVDGLLHANVSQEVVVALTYHTNDPQSQRDMDQWFNTQSADTLNQNVFLYTPAGQISLLKYRPPQGNKTIGAQFIFPRLYKGEPILQPGATGRLRFQFYQPQIAQTMYIDFKPEDMTYKGELSY